MYKCLYEKGNCFDVYNRGTSKQGWGRGQFVKVDHHCKQNVHTR